MDYQCWKCEKDVDAARLTKCPVCFKHFCEEHCHNMAGRIFCSPGCADYFFFAEADE